MPTTGSVRNIAIIAITLEIFIILLTAYYLQQRAFLPSFYYITSILIGIILVISVYRIGHHRILIFQILLIHLFLINVYSLSTNYSSIPFGDSYTDYGVLKTFIEEGRVFVIKGGHPSNYLTWYSGWPMLHIVAATLSIVTNVDPFYVTLFFPSLLAIGSFVFVYLLVERSRQGLGLNSTITYLSLLLYAISPDVIYGETSFVRQTMGTFLMYAMFFLILLSVVGSKYRNRRVLALTMLFAVCIVLTHHYGSFVASYYLFVFSVLIIISKRLRFITKISGNLSWLNPKLRIGGLAILSIFVLLAWWTYYGENIYLTWRSLEYMMRAVFEIIGGFKKVELPSLRVTYYPDSLTPSWALLLLRARDIALYVPALFGFVSICLKKTKASQKFFVTYSLMALGLFLAISFALSTTILQEQDVVRPIIWSMPFLGLSTSIFYEKLQTKMKGVLRILIPLVILIVVFSSFTGLWAHRYVPAHLYDPSINSVDVGEHIADPIRLKESFSSFIAYENITEISADDFILLYVILPANQYEKIQLIYNPKNRELIFEKYGIESNMIIFELRRLNLYSYSHVFRSPFIELEERELKRLELQCYLDRNFNLLYSNGDSKIWKTVKSAR